MLLLDARLQTRVQRCGRDRASEAYEPLWKAQLAGVQRALVDCARPQPGERVLDVACGTGLVSFAAAQAVGRRGQVHGIDLSDRMIEAAARSGHDLQLAQTSFTRMDAGSGGDGLVALRRGSTRPRAQRLSGRDRTVSRGRGYRVPAEFVVVAATVPDQRATEQRRLTRGQSAGCAAAACRPRPAAA